MHPNQLLPALGAVAIGSVQAAMGPAFSLGPVAENSWIREAVSTLVLPDPPQGSQGDASLWVGMGTSNGDLIQSIADSWQGGAWTVFGYTLVKTGDNSQSPVQTDPYPAEPGDRVTMHCKSSPDGLPPTHAPGSEPRLTKAAPDKFDDASGNYTQVVSLNGEQVATLSTQDGHAQGWGSAIECAEENCGTMASHKWEDTTITLDVADPNFINTLALGDGVTGELTTSDGGKTWTVAEISIPSFTF